MSESLPDAAPPALLSLRKVSVSRGGRRVLSGVSFDLARGEAIVLKGANGAGKTTLLRAIAGFLGPEHGDIFIDGVAGPSARRSLAVYCGHADAVKAAMSVRENLDFWVQLYGAGRERVAAALDALDIAPFAGRRAADLSAGQRRRLALTRAVISGKPLWLLDEPTASMDTGSAGRLVDLIEAHRRDGGAAIVATHDLIQLGDARALVIEAAP